MTKRDIYILTTGLLQTLSHYQIHLLPARTRVERRRRIVKKQRIEKKIRSMSGELSAVLLEQIRS